MAQFIKSEDENYNKFAARTATVHKQLYQEAVSMLIPEGMSPPELNKGFFYFQRYDEDGHLRFCRVPADVGGKLIDTGKDNPLEEEILSVGDLAMQFSGTGFAEVSAAKISVDNTTLGFVADTRGDERWTLMFRDLLKKKYWSKSVDKVRNFEWIDNTLVPGRFLYFTEVDPVTLRSIRVVRAELNPTQGVVKREIVWELDSSDTSSYVDLFKSKDGKCVFMSSSSKTRSEVHVVPADDPFAVPKIVHPATPGVEYFCEHRDGYIYVVSNMDYVNFALYRTPLADPTQMELVYHSPDLTITDIDMFRRGLVLYGHGFEGQPAVEILRFKGSVDPSTVPEDLSDYDQFGIADIVKVPFKGNYSIGKIEIGVNGDFESDNCRFTFRSPRNPGTCLQFLFEERKLAAVKSREFQRNADVDMVVERVGVNATSGDAVIPLTLVMPEGRDGPGPCLVYVYGAYGQVLEPDFSPAVLSLVKRGWTVAFAHVRGGGERGPDWHKAGSKSNRLNGVSDFEACCQWLVKEGVTTPEKLCAVGASAGGVVLGAALNVYGKSLIGGAAILRVPFVDLYSTLADPNLPLSLHERDEWGDVNDPTEAEVIKAVSPIDNLVKDNQEWYPPMFITCAEDDTRVPFEGVVTYAQALRTHTKISSKAALVLKSSKAGEGGHFGSASSAGNYEDTCTELAFLFDAISNK